MCHASVVSLRVIERLRRLIHIMGLAALGILCSVSLASAAQTLAQMYHTGWTVRDGAPRAIYSIATTTDGFLWLSTGDGLYRFDGQSFEHYRPRSGDPFPGSFMPALRATPDGGLWIGYGGLGAASFLLLSLGFFSDPSPVAPSCRFCRRLSMLPVTSQAWSRLKVKPALLPSEMNVSSTSP